MIGKLLTSVIIPKEKTDDQERKEMSMKKIAGLFGIFLFSSSLFAQNVPPILMAEIEKESKPLSLSKIVTDVKIYGYLAETMMTMTFYNPHNRQLAGDLYFPLPEGAAVNGYALDIKGVMVDGVIVEKQKGRVVFEKIVRKGIDPGLLEWVKGNNFKTRIFPIPAKGSRTIMVKYISELAYTDKIALYHLPLNFREKVKEFSLRIEVIKAISKPIIKEGGPEGIRFNKWRESYVAETILKNAELTQDLIVALPDIERQKVMVQKGSDDEFYFFINDLISDAGQKSRKRSLKLPEHITIFWDVSGSRGRTRHKKELGILKDYFEENTKRTISVDLIFFSNEKTKAKNFTIADGQTEQLLEALENVYYDGGTQMGVISPSEDDGVPDFYLLFTDGLSNFGKNEPKDFKAPVYIFSDDSQSDHTFLRYLAFQTGGEYFNLTRLDEKIAVSRIGVSPFSFISATFEADEIYDVYPKSPQPVQEKFMLSGKLQAEKANIIINYGRNNKITKKVEFSVSKRNAVNGDLLRIFWAQKKIHDLMIFQEKKEEELTYTGKIFGLVTPGTSLIVLESLEQHVEHEIVPPESLPEMRKEYGRIMEQRNIHIEKTKQEKLEYILKLWKEKVNWWNKDFKYTRDFKYKKEKVRPFAAPAREEERVEEAARFLREAPPPPAQAAESAKKSGLPEVPGPAISLKEWDPDTPYLKELKKAKREASFPIYMKQKKAYGNSPAFFLDCADFFFKNEQKKIGLRVLSNIAELELENAQLLRVLAHRLAQLDLLDLSSMIFEQVLKLRPEEPQSYRDFALVLARQKKYKRAVELMYQVVQKQWDRFREIELIALMELNNIIEKAKRGGIKEFDVDPRFIKLLDVDIRIILTWDTDLTDMDLWIIEPSKEKAFYGHRLTTIGGHVSRDFTDGYGPEEYLLKKTMPGKYKIQANYYGSSAPTLVGAVTLQVEIFTNYGRKNEKRKSITLRLTQKKEVITVGEIEF